MTSASGIALHIADRGSDAAVVTAPTTISIGDRSMKPRRRHVLLAAGTALTLTAATAVDLAVEHTARHRIAQKVACRLHPSGGISADLTSPLAGLRTLTGDVGDVRVDARGVRNHNTDLDLHLNLRGVTTAGTVGSATASAVIGFDELQKHLTRPAVTTGPNSPTAPATLGDDGTDLAFTQTLRGMPVTVVAALSTTPDSLTITPTELQVLGRSVPISALSPTAASGLADKLKPRTIHLPHLPAGTALTSATAGPDGLSLNLAIAHPTAKALTADHPTACA
ncbi:DUF2993 domain-containing protein [Catenulispora sp. NF23]|uniref:DUF2993 domain-containing protein n=1 Tax=Catenulispora pinistramenti TaxID=2705254 RepID=A0ABS5KHR3_9ACTN|nr:DUF2993 domain-containing protein [Catenulispora pinistramenti]MBS2533883.1 DUF2993 domain-containing protein [Catenulispora pinistramenti]MBS2545907.1 DUF2993 domain-containing protein [Catenulispora pinistramenti]